MVQVTQGVEAGNLQVSQDSLEKKICKILSQKKKKGKEGWEWPMLDACPVCTRPWAQYPGWQYERMEEVVATQP